MTDILTYENNEGDTVTIAFDYLKHYPTKKIKSGFFPQFLYTLVSVRYGAETVIKEGLTYDELMKYRKELYETMR